MSKKKVAFLTCSILFFSSLLMAQDCWQGFEHLFTPVQKYVVYQTQLPVSIDGKADEQDWAKAEWTADFADIEGDKKPRPLFRTRMKMLWDENNLYLLAELEEPHIWAYYDMHDQIVYHENDLEVFIDPDGDTRDYYEYEVNARNTLFDLKMPKPYRNGGQAVIVWNSKGFQSAVFVDGTLNDPKDTDKKWTVEMKIPFADLKEDEQVPIPAEGQIWKINFSRVNWRSEVVDGKYQKIKDPATGKAFPEYNWVWSPPGLIDMHYPERWGMILFSQAKPGSQPIDFKVPAKEGMLKYLWLVYYKQQKFRNQNNRYTTSLEELGVVQRGEWMNPDNYEITLKTTDLQFTVQILTTDGWILSVNETGLFSKSKMKKP